MLKHCLHMLIGGLALLLAVPALAIYVLGAIALLLLVAALGAIALGIAAPFIVWAWLWEAFASLRWQLKLRKILKAQGR